MFGNGIVTGYCAMGYKGGVGMTGPMERALKLVACRSANPNRVVGMTGPMERALKPLQPSPICNHHAHVGMTGPMERALKHHNDWVCTDMAFCWNDRPDGEGIETNNAIQLLNTWSQVGMTGPMERALKPFFEFPYSQITMLE